ncbi:MAG: TetR/AcrR family transcriptional regulator [Hyphomicrobium sp.]
MTSSHDERQPSRRGYHHGDLRAALVRAAVELLAKNGASGLTFAEAARVAGVSPAAPYRHYRDRDELLTDVARIGFELLAVRLERAWKDGSPTAIAALDRVARAYLEFASAEPGYFIAMFEAGVAVGLERAVAQESERAFEVVRLACSAVLEIMPEGRRPPPTMMALHVWSLLHGTAALFARGDDARRRIPMPPGDLVEAALLVYLQGLGAVPGR